MFESEIITIFMHQFLPTNVSERSSSSRLWLYQAAVQAQPDTALHLALGALSLARVGHINNDKQLAWQGQTVYCRALPALQKALYDERYMWDESTLAAGRTLEKYEVSDLRILNCVGDALTSPRSFGKAVRNPWQDGQVISRAWLVLSSYEGLNATRHHLSVIFLETSDVLR